MTQQFKNAVVLKNNLPVTTSFSISRIFQVRHTEILQDIRNVDCSNDFRRKNYIIGKTPPDRKQKPKFFFVTRDGFFFLATKFNPYLKEKYMEAFDKKELQSRNNYVNQILKETTENFNSKIKKAIEEGKLIYGENYGRRNNIIPTIPFYQSYTFEENLSNISSFVNNAYLGCFTSISELEHKEVELQDLKMRIINAINS